jgi:hypothetical protein
VLPQNSQALLIVQRSSAVIRILYELERILQHQLIWFLAPTVSLCTQQFEYLQSQISAVQIKCLKGDDGVDRWTSQNDWDTVLNNVRIVVSTFQVLLDALSHGFVKMGSLALIVFDEGKLIYKSYEDAGVRVGGWGRILCLRSELFELFERLRTNESVC